jgi:hypothetical protein
MTIITTMMTTTKNKNDGDNTITVMIMTSSVEVVPGTRLPYPVRVHGPNDNVPQFGGA